MKISYNFLDVAAGPIIIYGILALLVVIVFVIGLIILAIILIKKIIDKERNNDDL